MTNFISIYNDPFVEDFPIYPISSPIMDPILDIPLKPCADTTKTKNSRRNRNRRKYKNLKNSKNSGPPKPQTPEQIEAKKALTHKKKCRYCNVVKVCRTCHQVINCLEITDCEACGDLYGRPKKGPISAGCLIIDKTSPMPTVWLVMETDKNDHITGTLNDPGGKFDPDNDLTHIDTICREIKEELGFLIINMSKDDLYVDLDVDGRATYRCYILIHDINSPKFIRSGVIPEHPVVKISVKHLVSANKKALDSRLNIMFRQQVQNAHKKMTLKNYLESISGEILDENYDTSAKNTNLIDQ